jgi:hypothetical protein
VNPLEIFHSVFSLSLFAIGATKSKVFAESAQINRKELLSLLQTNCLRHAKAQNEVITEEHD